MKMKNFIVTMVVLCGVGFIISAGSSLSGTNSPQVNNISVRPRVSVPVPTVSENVVDENTITIKQLSTKDASVIQLNAEVNESTVDGVIKKIKLANRAGKKAIYLILNSPGGSVFDGIRLINAMDISSAPIYTIGVDFCASMCAHILQHGKERYMTDRSRLMFHPASTSLMVEGEVDKIYSRLGSAKRSIDKLDIYDAKRSGQNYVEFKAKRDSEYWTDSEDALRDHLIDAIVNIEYEKEVLPTLLFGNEFKLDLHD